MDDRDQPAGAEGGARVVATGRRGLGRVTAALQGGHDVVADLKFGHAVHDLRGEPAVPGEVAGGGGQQPQAVPARAVQAAIPVDPLGRLLPGLRTRVVGHDLGISEQGGHVAEVA
jgi:hypothetical protein